MGPGLQAGEQVEMGGGDEKRDIGQQRHQPWPQRFPGQRRARHANLAPQAGRFDRRGRAGVHRLPFKLAFGAQAFGGSIQGGNRSAESISSIVGLGRMTANRVPSTITSGTRGRLL